MYLEGGFGQGVLLAALRDERLALAFRLLLLETLARRLQIVGRHLVQARLVLLRVQPGAQHELGTLPVAVVVAGRIVGRRRRRRRRLLAAEVVHEVLLDFPAHGTAETAKLFGHALELLGAFAGLLLCWLRLAAAETAEVAEVAARPAVRRVERLLLLVRSDFCFQKKNRLVNSTILSSCQNRTETQVNFARDLVS